MIEKIKNFVKKNSLPSMVVGALLVAGVLTGVSLSLYVSSGASRLDFSRPGYEKVRDQISDSNSGSTFSPTGAINQKVVTEFLKRFDDQRAKLDELGDFGNDALSDEVLGL